MPRRQSEIFDTDEDYGTLPKRNMSYDMMQKEMQDKQQGIGMGLAGAVWENSRIVDSNMGSIPVMCNTLVGHTHWMSGGEFTLPYPGVPSVIYSENGIKGTILGYIPAKEAKSYFRLSYAAQVKPDVPIFDEHAFGEFKGGYPPDISPGDQGYINLDGYGYGMLSNGPVFMRANPFAAMEFFDINDQVRLSSFNFLHYTGGGERRRFTNEKRRISNETLFCTDEFIDPSLDEVSTEKEAKEEVKEYKSEYKYMSFLGSIGGIFTEHLKNSYHRNLHYDGTLYSKSISGFLFSVGKVPIIEDVISTFDPERIDEEEEMIEEEFEWNEDGKRLSQELFYLSNSYNKFYKQFITNVTEQDKIIKPQESVIHSRDDGSIILMSKSGSVIELDAEGDIIISPKRHLKLQSGGSTIILAGEEIHQISKKGNYIRSTDESVNIIAKETIQNYAHSGITLEVEGLDGINLLAKRSSINSIGYDIYHKATNNLINKSNLEHNETKLSQSKKDLVINNFTNKYENGKNIIIKASKNMSVQSDVYSWSGRRFSFNSSQSGVINAAKPVRINHVHQEGHGGSGDIFTLVSCLKGCRVKKIVTPPLGLPDYKQTFVPQREIEIPETKEVEIQDPEISDLEYDFTPWQMASSAYWPSLALKVKDKNVFPIGVPLKTFTGENFQDIPWQSYRI